MPLRRICGSRAGRCASRARHRAASPSSVTFPDRVPESSLHSITIRHKSLFSLADRADKDHMQPPMTDRPVTPLLDQVSTPEELRKLKPEQLRQLADELREET